MNTPVMHADIGARFETGRLAALGIGHSHLSSLQSAYSRRVATSAFQQMDTHFVQLLDERLRPNFHKADGRYYLNAELIEQIRNGFDESRLKRVVFMCISGNEYQFIGLFNHPRVFDFFLLERPELPIEMGREVIPVAVLERRFAQQVSDATLIVPLIRELLGTDVPICAVESPPPIGSNEFIRSHQHPFPNEVARYGVSPPALRLKLWTLQSRMYRERLSEMGVMYLPCPDEAVGADGFIREEGWHPDSVHASPWYGEAVLRQIAGLFSSPQTGGK